MNLDQLKAFLAGRDSATEALREWCRVHDIGGGAAIVAQRANDAALPAPDAVRKQLDITANQPLGYRHVVLTCGELALSEAHNWFVQERLSPALNHELETTNRPFGAVIAKTRFQRQRLCPDWHIAEAACPADTVLTTHAVIRLPNGTPLAYVIECYRQELLQQR